MEYYYNTNNFYEVETIITKKKLKKKNYYLIKWKGYPVNESTWEPISNLKNVQYLINNFENDYPDSIDKKLFEIFQNKSSSTKLVKSSEKNLLKKKKFREKIIKNEEKENFSETNQNDELDLLKGHLYIKIKEKNIEKEVQENSSKDLTIDLIETESPATTIKESEKENENRGYFLFENLNKDDQTYVNSESHLIMPRVII